MFAEFCVTPTPARRGGGFLAGLGKFSAGKVGKSVWVLTVVESIILLQSWTVSTRCLSENPFQVSVVSS